MLEIYDYSDKEFTRPDKKYKCRKNKILILNKQFIVYFK